MRELRPIREGMKVRQEEVAASIGVSRLTYIKYEKDINLMPLGKYLAALDYLHELVKFKIGDTNV